MTEHVANICARDNHVGTTLCIEGGSLHVNDTVRLTCPSEPDGSAVIRYFGPGRLDIEMNSQTLVCRPWQAGDPPVERRHGTSSSWVVVRVEADDMVRT